MKIEICKRDFEAIMACAEVWIAREAEWLNNLMESQAEKELSLLLMTGVLEAKVDNFISKLIAFRAMSSFDEDEKRRKNTLAEQDETLAWAKSIRDIVRDDSRMSDEAKAACN